IAGCRRGALVAGGGTAPARTRRCTARHGGTNMADAFTQRLHTSTPAGRLSGKHTIVTGAGSGIGRASARKFAAEGAAVLAVDRDQEAVDTTVKEISAAGGKAIAVAADVGAEPEVEAFIARAVEAFGGLHAIYANAGISGGLVP